MNTAPKTPYSQMDIARFVVVALGAILSIVGGATPWITGSSEVPSSVNPFTGAVTYTKTTLTIGLITSNGSPTASIPHLAGGALLIVGFIFGLINFILLLSERQCGGTPCCGTTRFAFAIVAFITTLAGTILGGASPLGSGTTQTLAYYVTEAKLSWGPGFGCSIVACLLQAAALALVSMAYCSKPSPAKAVSSQSNLASGYGQTTQSPLSRV